MVLYNDAAVLYDDPSIAYDGGTIVIPLLAFRNVTRGYTFEIRHSSLSISDSRPCELARLDGAIDDIELDIILENEDEIEVTHTPEGSGSTVIFAGDVTRRVRTEHAPVGLPRVYQITAQDFTARLADNIITSARNVVESAEDRVAWIVGFSDRGLTFDSVESISDEVGEFDYTGMSVQGALSQVAQLVNAIYYVDYDKDLHFFQSEVVAAPFELIRPADPPDSQPYGDFQIEDASPDIAHAVLVRGDGVQLWREMVGAPVDATRQERSVTDMNIKTVADAEALGDALLAKWSESVERGSLVVHEPGLRGGMSVRIANPDWSIDETFLVTSVRTSLVAPEFIAYRVDFAKHYLCGPTQADFNRATTSLPVLVKDEVAQTFIDMSIAGSNQVPNSSFESASNWTVGSLWSMGWASAAPYHGPKTSRVNPSGTASGELVSAAYIIVDRTDDWWFSFWSHLTAYTAGVARCRIREYDSSNVLLQSTDIDISSVESAWTRHSVHFGPTAKEGRLAFHASTAKVKVVFYATTSPTLTWEIDAVQLERSAVLTAYAPAPNEIADDSITTTKIADDSITTPKLVALAITTAKLAANAVIAYVLNVGSTVQIDADGILVTGGAITVQNSGATVIIDGESDILRVAASGTQSVTVGTTDTFGSDDTALPGLGVLADVPIVVSSLAFGNTATTEQGLAFNFGAVTRGFIATSSGGAVTANTVRFTGFTWGSQFLNGSNFADLFINYNRASGASSTAYQAYYVLLQAAF